MSFARRLSLRPGQDGWRLVQAFCDLEPVRGGALPVKRAGERLVVALVAGDAVEVEVRCVVGEGGVTLLLFANSEGERLEIGYDQDAAELFVDRGGTRGFRHRFFTDKFAAARLPGTREVDLHLVCDRCTLEVLAFAGEVSMSLLAFFGSPPERLSLEGSGPVEMIGFEVHRLSPSIG